MADSNVIAIQSQEEWQEKLQQSIDEAKLLIVDFTASWCGPCKTMAPHLDTLSVNYPDVIFLKVDVDQFQEICAEYGIESMPTFLIFKEGNQIDKVVGANKSALEEKVELHASLEEDVEEE